jgi:hypothetical protein
VPSFFVSFVRLGNAYRSSAAGVQDRSYPFPFLNITLDEQSEAIQEALDIARLAKARGSEFLNEVQA